MARNLFDLSGKTAFVTGATKGIGRAIVEAYVDHGAVVALSSRKGGEAEAAAREINARAGREAAVGVEADLGNLDQMLAAYDAMAKRLGKIDILVCNAAETPDGFGSASDFPREKYLRLMELNIINNAMLMNHAAVAMKARRDGVILATSSAGGSRASYGIMPYGVSKAGLNHVVRSLGAELAPYNVRVNGVAPGLTMSYSLQQAIRETPEAIEAFKMGVPLGRIIDAEEIAAGMVFLASEGGKAMTGQVILMDGGEPGSGTPPAA